MKDEFKKKQFAASATPIYDRMPPEMQLRAQIIGRLHSYRVETEFDERFAVYFEEMMLNITAQLFGGAGKQRVIFVIGESNSGKTSLVRYHLFRRPELQPFTNANGEEISPILCLDAPGKITGKAIALACLSALDYEVMAKSMTVQELYAEVVRQMIEKGKLIIHIDEMQQIVPENDDDKIGSVADVMKLLAQVEHYPIHLIFSGLPTIASLLSAHKNAPNRDQQLSNRSQSVIELPQLNPEFEMDRKIVTTVMRDISRSAGISISFDIDLEFLSRLVHASSKAFGSVVEIIKKAFINALTFGDKAVTIENFAAAYAQWRGCLPEENIIIVNNWADIKPKNSVSRMLSAKHGNPAPTETETDEDITAIIRQSGLVAKSKKGRK